MLHNTASQHTLMHTLYSIQATHKAEEMTEQGRSPEHPVELHPNKRTSCWRVAWF